MMILTAPSWSPASVQFVHGYPRRLVDASHGGFLPGNIIVAASASNLCLRRMAICDVARLASSRSVQGVGLTYAKLVNLRYAAIKYQGRSQLPNYLVRGMLEVGVSFSTFEAISVDSLSVLADSLRPSWEAAHSDSEGDEMLPAELPVGVLSGIGNQPQENASESQTQGQLTSLLSCAVDGQLERSADESDNQGQEGQPQTVRRRRKRRGMAGSSTGGSKRPREQPAESQATAASAQVAGKFRVSRSRYVDCSSCKLTLCFQISRLFRGYAAGNPRPANRLPGRGQRSLQPCSTPIRKADAGRLPNRCRT